MIFRRLSIWLCCSALVSSIALASLAQDAAPPDKNAAGKAKLKSSFVEDLGIGGGLPGGSGDVTLSATYKVVRDTREGKLSVTAEITPGWHIYSLTQKSGGPQKSEIVVEDLSRKSPEDAGSFELGSFAAESKPEVHYEKFWPGVPIEEHEGTITWTAPLTISKDTNVEKLPIKLIYSGQVCETKGTCIPIDDREIPVQFAGYVEPGATPGEYRTGSANLVWKGHLEPKVVAPGTKARLVLTATPDPGWHLYSYSVRPAVSGSQPTLIVLTNTASWLQYAVTPSISPKTVPPKSAGDETQTYYDQPITFTIELIVPPTAEPGKATLIGYLGFQTCNDKTCLMPSGAKFSVTVPIAESAVDGQQPLEFEESSYDRAAKEAAKAAPAYGTFDPQWHGTLLALSFIGGLLLNLMPCVLPVLGLKIMSFVQQGGHSRFKVIMLNFWYTLGLLAVFMLLATLSAFLNVGWGEQMTETWFRVTMLVMTFAFGLSFLGVWEIPIPGFASTGKANDLQAREGASGAFFKGVFTTVLGVSCSGPFLGGVFGLTLTQPPLVTYLIFLCVGLGMAFPFLAVALIPQTQGLLPKPGEWMNTFKHLMGFVMLGVAVWLFSTIGNENAIPTLTLLVGVGFACWWIGRVPVYEETRKQLTAWAAGIVIATAVGYAAFAFLGPIQYLYKWDKYSPETLARLQAEGKTVMVDFTADWCANCHLNMRWAINTHKVKQVVDKNGVVALVADWSDKNKELKAKLAELGSRSIPVLAIYPAGKKPDDVIILRDIVTANQIVAELERAGPSKDVAAKRAAAAGTTAEAKSGKQRAG